MVSDGFQFFRPCAVLEPFIRYYWVLRCDEERSALTFPIGCPQLIFHRGSCFRLPELDLRQARFSISGQVNFPAIVSSERGVETIVVVFRPHALATVFGVPVATFYNREIDGFALGDRALNRLAQEVLNADSAECAIKVIDRRLAARLSEAMLPEFDRVDAVMRYLAAERMAVRVEEMARRACLSRKQFERVFFKTVGMNPKEYSAIVRFQRAMWLMQRGVADPLDVVGYCGYADQSHFIRECRRFSGMTPGRLINSGQACSELF